MKKLIGKTIVVVGATGGIGRVLSKYFYEEGANVVLASRTEEKLNKLRTEIGIGRSMVVATDATDAKSVTQLFERAAGRFKKIDAVVISVGTWERLSSHSSIEGALMSTDKLYNSIYKPTMVVAFIAQSFFREAEEGIIFNISSHAAVRPSLKGNLSYGPMKAAARHFMLSLGEELKGTGVSIVDIQPAIVNTEEAAKLLDTEEKRKRAVQPESIALWIADQLDRDNVPSEKLFDSGLIL